MFRKIIFLFILSIITFSIQAQNKPFVLKGVFLDGNFDGQTAYIQKMSDNGADIAVLDSVIVKNKGFVYNGFIDDNTPSMLFLSVSEVDGQRKNVLFSPEVGEVTVSIGEKTIVGGTPKNVEIQQFLDLQNNLGQELKQIVSRFSNMPETTENQNLKVDAIESVRTKLSEATYNFARSNIDNDMGEYIVLSFYSILSPDQMLDLLNQTRPEFKESKLGKDAFLYCDAMIMREGRGSYKDITLTGADGKDVSLSDYVGKNKLVLLDFWASWCGPCLKEIPNLVDFYQVYKDKGFQIIGVSLDEKEDAWKYAIERFGMVWPQMSDLKGWDSSVAQLYGVASIPYMILLDEKGDIIASYFTTEEMFDKVKELLD